MADYMLHIPADAENIGEGWHERAIIDQDRFLARVAAKRPR